MPGSNLEHFEGRLEKDSYSKDEVAKMLLNESKFSEQKTRGEYNDHIAKKEFDEVNTKLTETEAKLKPYEEAKFNDSLIGIFGKLNGNKDKTVEFRKLGDIDSSMDEKTIEAKAIEMKKSGKYGYLFNESDSGAVKGSIHTEPKQINPGIIVPKIGLFNIFNKKK